jgi:hypothetical protein
VCARSHGAVAMLVAGSALSLTCCDDSASWFAKPFNPSTPLSYLSLAAAGIERPITAADLIDADGACPSYVEATPQPSGAGGAGEGVPLSRSSPFDDSSVAVGMSECAVVARLRQATAVDYGTAPNGSRSVVLTYRVGLHAGIYRFKDGRLAELNRVERPPPTAQRNSAKKKPPKFGTATSGERS